MPFIKNDWFLTFNVGCDIPGCVQTLFIVPFAVMEIGFEKTNYVFSEAAVVPLCVKIYSGQLATELALKVQSYDESAHGL